MPLGRSVNHIHEDEETMQVPLGRMRPKK